MKSVLITGANRGVGFALARMYIERGDRVFAGCRLIERAAELEKLSSMFPGKVTILPLDVSNEESIDISGSLVEEKVDGLDVLINNAAIHAEAERISTFSREKALDQLLTNAVGQLLVAKRFIHLLRAGKEPRIVNVSSEAGSISEMKNFRGYYYFGSKAALNMYTRALAWDPETHGITVIAIHPGWVRTEMGGAGAPISPAQSAAGILRVVDELDAKDNGKFFTWEGGQYPW